MESRLKEFMRQRMVDLEWNVMDLAKAYGCLKENRSDVDPNRYRNTVVKMLEHPDSSRFDTVRLCLMAMGCNIYAA